MNYLGIIVITLIFSAFFAGMEIAFLTSNKLRIELNKKQGLFSARFISVFISNPSQYIATMQVGNNIGVVIFGLAMANILGPLIRHFSDSELTILIIQTLVTTFIILMTAEFLPKTLVRINPNLVLNVMSLPMIILYYLLYPLAFFMTWISNLVIRGISKSAPGNRFHNMIFDKIDLSHLIHESQQEKGEQYLDDENEIKLFQNALDFSNVKLRDCMVPRTEIAAMEVNNTVDALKQKFIETGYSKILIYEDTIDNIIGYVTSKDLLKILIISGPCLLCCPMYRKSWRPINYFRNLSRNIRVWQ